MALFSAARFALGVALGGTGQTSFTYVIEVTPTRLRGAANNVVMASFAVAEIAVALLAARARAAAHGLARSRCSRASDRPRRSSSRSPRCPTRP